jgi:hypothetical protein
MKPNCRALHGDSCKSKKTATKQITSYNMYRICGLIAFPQDDKGQMDSGRWFQLGWAGSHLAELQLRGNLFLTRPTGGKLHIQLFPLQIGSD